MGKPAKDITGITVGYVTAIKKLPSVRTSCGLKPKWLCRCVCGTELVLFTSPFLRGQNQSCGCKKKELISKGNKKHGLSHHPIYAVWDTMIARCHRPSHKSYEHYNARGIEVCDRWRKSFQSFADDMLATYKKGLLLERINNDKGYTPENCKWATPIEQANNTSTNHFIATPDGVMTVNQASRKYDIKPTTLLNRIASNWPEKALFIKPDFRNRIK